MGKVVPASLWLDIFSEVVPKLHKDVARDFAAFKFAKVAVFDGLENLRFGAENRGLGLFDQTVDHCRKRWIFLLLKAARFLEFFLTFDNPSVGRLPAVKALRLAMDDGPG